MVDGLSIGLLQNNFDRTNGPVNALERPLYKYGKYKVLANVAKLRTQERHHFYPTSQGSPQVVYNYEYNNFLQLSSKSKNVDGDIYKTVVNRPLDIWNEQITPPSHWNDEHVFAIFSMVNKNMLNTTIETRSLKNGKVISGKLNFFKLKQIDPTSNIVLTDEIDLAEISDPTIAEETFIDIEGDYDLIYPDFYYTNAYFDSYDDDGNLLSYHKDGNAYNTILYGYNNSLPIAEFSNAFDPGTPEGGDCGFLSFESGSTDIMLNNYWVIGDEVDVVDTDAHTGEYSCKIGGKGEAVYSTQRTFCPSHQEDIYVLSAWVKPLAGYADNGGIGYELYDMNDQQIPSTWQWVSFNNTVSDWQYIEKKIDLQDIKEQLQITEDVKIKAFTVNNNTNDAFLIDDMMFHPEESFFSTKAVDPTKGLTAVTGSNNTATHSTFDDLSRPKLLLNDDHQILKRNTYNYAGDQIKTDIRSYDFGNVNVDGFSETHLIKVFNNSEVSQSVSFSLSQFGDEDFQLMAGTGSHQIAPGSFHSIEIKFDPVSVGKKSTYILIDDDNEIHDRVINIVGNGAGINCCFKHYGDNNFGLVRINSPEVAYYIIRNNYGEQITGNISITGDDDTFLIEPGKESFVIEDGKYHLFYFEFSPDDNTEQNATATINFTGPQGIPDETASLSGLGFHTINFDIQAVQNYCNQLSCEYTFEAINLDGNPSPADFNIVWYITDEYGVYQEEETGNPIDWFVNFIHYPCMIRVKCIVSQINGDTRIKEIYIENPKSECD